MSSLSFHSDGETYIEGTYGNEVAMKLFGHKKSKHEMIILVTLTGVILTPTDIGEQLTCVMMRYKLSVLKTLPDVMQKFNLSIHSTLTDND
jgi:hypothetical protein